MLLDDARLLDQDALLTTDEAARALGIKRSTLEKWTRQGKVASYKIGGLRRYRLSDLREFIARSRQDGKSA